MKTKEDWQDTFSRYFFRNVRYCYLSDAGQAFVDFHVREYDGYRKSIARLARKMRHTRKTGTNDYGWIFTWYKMRIQFIDVLNGMHAGEEWAREKGIPISSIGLFKQFVYARYNRKYEIIKSHLRDYKYGEGYDSSHDQWFYELFKALYLGYHEEYYFDPYWGYLHRRKIYVGAWKNREIMATDFDVEEMRNLGGYLKIEKAYRDEPFPHFLLTKKKRDEAIKAGVKKADRNKIKEIEECFSGKKEEDVDKEEIEKAQKERKERIEKYYTERERELRSRKKEGWLW